MPDSGCVVACVIARLTVKSRIRDLHSEVTSGSHPASEGADCIDVEADTPSSTLRRLMVK